jgi:hypothetical protein
MKRKRSMFFKVALFLIFSTSVGLGILLSCEKVNLSPVSKSTTKGMLPQELQDEYPYVEICGTVVAKKLLMIEKKVVGTAFVFNDRHYLYVHAVASNNFMFHNSYLYAGMKDEVPMTTEGDPNVLAFKHKIEDVGTSTIRNFKIPLRSLSGTFAIGLMLDIKPKLSEEGHLELKSWAQGYTIGQNEGKRGMLFAYKKGICLYDEPSGEPDPFE